MASVMQHLAVLGGVVFVGLSILWHMDRAHRWELAAQRDFEDALRRLNIECYELLAERSVAPGPHREPELYRIFHEREQRYFFYLRTGNSQGVLKPLSKERALLAARQFSSPAAPQDPESPVG